MKPRIVLQDRQLRWFSNGAARHVYERPGDAASLCGAVKADRWEAYPHPICLACLHAIGVGLDWHEYYSFRNDARGFVECSIE